MILALVSLALSLTAAGARQEAPPTLALENGLWFDGTGFSEETFYSVEGRFTRTKPARIAETLDLAGGFVVPPFGEANNHNVRGDAEARSSSAHRPAPRPPVEHHAEERVSGPRSARTCRCPGPAS